MRRWHLFLVMMVLLPAPTVFAQLPDGEGVMDKVTAVFRSMEDLSADVVISTATRQASGRIVLQYVPERSARNDVPAKFVRKYIVETRVETPEGIASLKQVSDGASLWIEQKNAKTGAVKVVRRKTTSEGPIPGGFGPDWRKDIDHWRKKYAFRTLRADSVDDQRVVVVEGVLRDEGEDPDAARYPRLSIPGRLLLSVSLKADFPCRVDLFAAKGQDQPDKGDDRPTVTVKLMHLRLNEGLDPQTFRYTVPPGADFVDEN